MSRPIDDLQFAVEEWTADGQRVFEVLALASNVLIARGAFEAATRLRPDARLTLRHGTRLIEAQPER